MGGDSFDIDEETLTKILGGYDIEEEDYPTVIQCILSGNKTTIVEEDILSYKQVAKLWKEVQGYEPILKTRFEVSKGEDKNVVAVIMGEIGSGKTSLLNNLCDTIYASGHAKQSLTREITLEKVRRLQRGCQMMVYDTPGTNTTSSMSLHATLLRETLIHKPLNVIFSTLSYKNRGQNLIERMREQAEIIGKYSASLVFLISHCDDAENIDTFIKDTNEQMNEKGMNRYQVIYFSNKQQQCNKRNLARKLFDVCSNYPKVQLKIDEETFLRNFPIGDLKKQFAEHYKITREKVERASTVFIQKALSLPKSSERPYILQELALYLKYLLRKELEAFTEKTKEKMLEHDYFGIYFAVQKVILDCTEDFYAKTRGFQDDRLTHELKEGQKIQDLFKQCPNCKQIWMKVNGCNDAICGNRPSTPWDFRVEDEKFKYDIVYDGVTVKILRRDQAKVNPLKNSESLTSMYSSRATRAELRTGLQSSLRPQRPIKKAVGCGHRLVYNDLPRIPNIEEILIRFFNVMNICEVEERLKLHTKTAEIKKEQTKKAKAQLKKCDDNSKEVEKPTQVNEDDETDGEEETTS